MIYDRAELGLDGNAAFALLGEDIQSGEAEFVTVENPENAQEVRSAAYRALANLRVRLEQPNLSYFIGRSHPYHC